MRLPDPVYVPAAQGVHLMLPELPLYSPAAHKAQVEAPVLLTYAPIAQGEQGTEPDAENWPAAQGVPRTVQLDDPATEIEPEAQSTHVDDADAEIVAEYMPAAHRVQGSFPFTEYWPATQGLAE